MLAFRSATACTAARAALGPLRTFSAVPAKKKTIQQLAKEISLKNQPVLVRADLNLPRNKEDGSIVDDTRARAVRVKPAVPTEWGLSNPGVQVSSMHALLPVHLYLVLPYIGGALSYGASPLIFDPLQLLPYASATHIPIIFVCCPCMASCRWFRPSSSCSRKGRRYVPFCCRTSCALLGKGVALYISYSEYHTYNSACRPYHTYACTKILCRGQKNRRANHRFG